MKEMSIDEALEKADANGERYQDVPSVSRTLATEVRGLRQQLAEVTAQRDRAEQLFKRCEIHLMASADGSDNKNLTDDAKELLAELQAIAEVRDNSDER